MSLYDRFGTREGSPHGSRVCAHALSSVSFAMRMTVPPASVVRHLPKILKAVLQLLFRVEDLFGMGEPS